jgi:hypothetical protein
MAEQQITRVDPEQRSLTGADLGTIRNPDPGKAYMLANPNEDMFGYAACEAQGWAPLMKGCKEKVIGARLMPDGSDRISVQGQIMMWRPKAEQAAYEARKLAYAQAQFASPQRNEKVVIDGNGKQS